MSDESASGVIETPLGLMLAASVPEGLILLEYSGGDSARSRLEALRSLRGLGFPERESPPIALARRELAEYFRGQRREFTVPLAVGGSPFQELVWAALRDIPYGQVRTYAELAAAIGRPRAVRAVGGANGRNPVAIIVPCHRVVAAGGRLGGYAGETWRKRKLLELEGVRTLV